MTGRIDSKSIELVGKYFDAKEKVKKINRDNRKRKIDELVNSYTKQGIDRLTAECMAAAIIDIV